MKRVLLASLLALAPLATARADGPPSFLEPAERPDAPAYFVRLRWAELGGNFDAAADEEVNAFVHVGDAERKLAFRVLDLPADRVRRFEFPEAPWVELRPAPRFTFALSFLDEDLSEWETITTTPADVAVEAGALGEEESTRVVTLDTIEGTEFNLFGPNKKIKIDGARCELGLIRAPRRDAPDEASRAGAQAALGALLTVLPPADHRGALALGERLGRLADQADVAAGRSTHTYLRRALPPLTSAVRDARAVAVEVGEGDPARLAPLQVDVARAAKEAGRREGLTPPARALVTRATALAARRAPTAEAPAEPAALEAEGRALVEALDALLDGPGAPEGEAEFALRDLGASLAQLMDQLEAVRLQADGLPRVRAALEAAQAALRAELKRPG